MPHMCLVPSMTIYELLPFYVIYTSTSILMGGGPLFFVHPLYVLKFPVDSESKTIGQQDGLIATLLLCVLQVRVHSILIYSNVLCSTPLCSTLLCSALHYTTLHHTTLHHTTPHHTTPHHTTPHHTTLQLNRDRKQ